MTGISFGLEGLPALFQPDVWLRWLPGALFAVVMLLVLKRYHHYLIMPGMILGALGLFYLVLLLFDVSIVQARDQGWLLGPFPEGGLWTPFSPADLFHT